MSTKIEAINDDDSRGLRNCLGQFATGVTVVTCADSSGALQGVTANSFSSVSLNPPLVLWSIGKDSDTLDAFLTAKHFCINILSAEQQALSNHFAQSEQGLFEDVDMVLSASEAPLLTGSLACLECRQETVHDAGDHHIIIGRVLGFGVSAHKAPLLFWGGNYAQVAPDNLS